MTPDFTHSPAHAEAQRAAAARRSARTFLAWLGATFVVLSTVNIGLSLHSGPIVGDLARVGGFAERDYAPQVRQPAPTIAPNTVALADADVVVLGDSFSNRLLWQGELEALTGKQTLTYQYGQVGCISNWLGWLQRQRLKPGAEVVIETAERSFVPRFSELVRCPAFPPTPVHRNLAAAADTPWWDTGYSLDIVYQGRVVSNSLRMGTQPSYRSGEVVNVALRDSQRFTNRRSDRLLYHVDDEGKNDWSAAQVASAIANLRAVQSRFAAAGIDFHMLVMPDKSTVYRDDIVEPRIRPSTITRDVHAAGLLAIDTTACLRALATQVPDFYLPDDTHTGVAGFRLVASSLAERRCAAPPTAYAAGGGEAAPKR
jgi:hypothetical protein